MKINLKEIEARCKASAAVVKEFPDLLDKATVSLKHEEAVAMLDEIRRLRAESAELKKLLEECEGPLKRLCSSFSGMVNDAVFGKAYTADCSSLRTLLTRIRAAIGEGK